MIDQPQPKPQLERGYSNARERVTSTPTRQPAWRGLLTIFLVLGALVGVAVAAVKLSQDGLFGSSLGTGNGGGGGNGPCFSFCTDCPANVSLPASKPLPIPDPEDPRGTPPWYVSSNLAGGAQPLTLVSDNVTSAGSEPVLRVDYPALRWGSAAGAEFKANPWLSLPADSAVLRYSVWFPPGFDWRKGGKLPGVCIGNSTNNCATGSRWAWDSGSVRVMWRNDGRAIGYVYLPLQTGGDGTTAAAYAVQGPGFKRTFEATGTAGDGLWCSVGGGLQLLAGEWNNVTLVVAMNTLGVADGVVALTINGETRVVGDVAFRTQASVQVNAVLFATFFGGNDVTWALTQPSYSLFKDFGFEAPATDLAGVRAAANASAPAL